MSELLVNPHTLLQLDELRNNLPHALIVTGKNGVGLDEAVAYIINDYTSFPLIVEPNEKDTITVEAIRNIYSQSNTKNSKKQIFIIKKAEKMSIPAQNALLKRLEEPIDNVNFILLTHTPQLLLSTITSRSQSVTVLPLTEKQYTKYIDGLHIADTKKKQIRYIAEGLPAETALLLQDEDYFLKRSKEVGLAKQFLQSSRYDKLISVNKISKDRANVEQLLLDSAHIIETMLRAKPDNTLAKQLSDIVDTYENIREDRNVRIQFLKLVLHAP